MKSKASQRSARTAFAGVLCALGVVVLFLGYATGVFDLCAVTLASFFIAVSVVELGGAYPYLIWICTSVLAFIILPDKLLGAEYALFGGIYPILKLYFEKIKSRVLEWSVKILFSSAVFAAVYALSKFVFVLPDEEEVFLPVIALMYVVFIVLYDRAITVAVTLYCNRLRSKLPMLKKLR